MMFFADPYLPSVVHGPNKSTFGVWKGHIFLVHGEVLVFHAQMFCRKRRFLLHSSSMEVNNSRTNAREFSRLCDVRSH